MNPEGSPAAPEPPADNVIEIPVIDSLLDTLFGATVAPHVMALSEIGLLIAMPAGVPVAPEHIISGVASALELCLPADVRPIVDAWELARKTRGAQVAVHLRAEPEQTLLLHFVDARHRYGVFLGIFAGTVGKIDPDVAPATLFRPRLTTLLRNELSFILETDDALTKILGWTKAELIGKRMLDFIHPEDGDRSIANWMEMLGRPAAQHRCLIRYRHRDDSYVWFEVTHQNLLNDPAHGYVISEFVDVSEQMEASEALRASEALLRRLTETLPLGILQIDTQRRMVYRNERLTDIVGVTEAATVGEQFANVAKHERHALETALGNALTAGAPSDLELSFELAGIRRRCSVRMEALYAESGPISGAIICVTDITERVRMREELERRAKFDNLTRCHNRESILEMLETAVQGLGRPGTGLAVLFVDLDQFKEVNDRYGHAAGDELLRRTGERLLNSVRSGDVVGRIGGDEFLIVCPEVDSPQLALDIARRIVLELRGRVTFGSIQLEPGASIGIAWSDGRTDADTLVASADAAMYESKRGDHAPVLRFASEPISRDR